MQHKYVHPTDGCKEIDWKNCIWCTLIENCKSAADDKLIINNLASYLMNQQKHQAYIMAIKNI